MFGFILRKEGVFFSTLFWRNLKIITVILLAGFFSVNGITQTYEKIYRTKLDDISEDAIELADKSIIISIASGSGYFSNSNYQANLYKLSPSGLFTDSTEINIPEYYNLNRITNIFKLSDTSYLSLGICRNILNDSIRILIIHFNSDLTIYYNTLSEFTLPGSYDVSFHSLNNDKTIVSIGTDFNEYNQFLYEYDLFGNLINHKYYIDSNYTPRFAAAIKEIDSLNKYHYFIFAFPQDFWIIDKQTLEIDTVHDYTETFSPWDCHRGFNNNKYFVTGRNYIGNGKKVPAFLEMDNMGNVLNMHSYTANPDTNSGNIGKSLDIFNDKIFLVAAYNFLVNGSYPFVQQQQWIWLNRINQDFSVSWQRFYKGEVNYMPYKILATSDGGALILSTKYDWNDSIPLQRDVHILKVDSTGWYEGLQTGTSEFDKPKQILVYPNPVKDKVKFVLGLYNNLELSIYNSNGQRVIRQKLPYSQTIDMSHFSKGLYVYILRGKNGFIEKGKLVKK